MLEFVVVALAQIDGPLIVLGDTESNLVTAPADERTRAAPIAMRQHGSVKVGAVILLAYRHDPTAR
jgi:hypothetical protein